MRALSAVGLVLALSVSLTACGDDSDDESDDSSTPSSSTEGSVTPADDEEPTEEATADAAADQAVIDAAVLTIDDMPTGWQAAPEDDQDDNSDELAACMGVDVSEFENEANPTADSDEFKSPDGTTVSNNVEIAASEDWMARAFEVQSSEEFRNCAGQSLEEELGAQEGVEYGEVRVLPMVSPTYGDETTAFRIMVPATTAQDSVVIVADFIAARVGRATVGVSLVTTSTPPSVMVTGGYLETSVQRLQAALGES